MIKVDVTLSDDTLMQLQSALAGFSGANGGQIMPRTKTAFDMATKLIQKSWQNWAMGGSIAGAADIRSPNPNLMRSIKIRRIGDFDVSIETDSPYMERIEQGSPEIRMKEVPNWIKGKKSRVSKKGNPFLIIPFQWGTPNRSGGARAHFSNTTPQSLYALIKKKSFKKSTQTGEIHIEKNWHGEDIQRAGYTWGDRVKFEDILNAAGDEGVSSNAVGMVRMLANSKSTYFTFRVISADSKAPWIRKAIPPNHVTEAIEKSLREEVNDLIQEGLEQELGL